MDLVKKYVESGLSLGAAMTSAIRDEQFVLDRKESSEAAIGLQEKWEQEFHDKTGALSGAEVTLGK